MRRVLVLAFYFPPIGGGGVQRVVKFCRYLPEFGYKPVVVTGPGYSTDRWAPQDATLVEEIPPEVEVHRIAGPEPDAPGRWRRRGERLLDVMPQALKWWATGSMHVGRSAGKGVDVILGELVPYASAQAAVRLSRELGRPWVADLQDPWALDEMWLYPSALHRARDLRRMKRLLGTASAIVMNTPEATARVRRRLPQLGARLTEAIPNGFDPADFEGVAAADRPARVFRIVHTGYLHTESGFGHRRSAHLRNLLGGAPVRGVDFLTRSHVFLLQAIDRLIAREPELAETIELHLAGVLTEVDRIIGAASPVVRMPGYLSHDDTVSLILSADLLFLPMHNLPTGVRAGLVPGKTYEYLGSGRPILAAVPDGDARDLLAETGNVLLCRPDDVTGMAESIATRLAQWRQGIEPPPPRPEVVARYERRRQTEQLARVLDRAVGKAGDALT